jgi:hypothetical protein
LSWEAPRLRDRESRPADERIQAGCCPKTPLASCERHIQTAAGGSVPEPSDEKNTSQLVLGFLARQCKGHHLVWQNAAVGLPPPVLLTWGYEWGRGDWLWITASITHSALIDPPVPPPRLA